MCPLVQTLCHFIKKKKNAMELIVQDIPNIEMSQTCTQKSKCGALTEGLKQNEN